MDLPALDIPYKWNHMFCDLLSMILSLSIMFSRLIYVTAWVSTSFLFTTEGYSLVRLNHILFTHSSTDGRLSCFYFLAIMNNAMLNICVQWFTWHTFPILLSFYLGVEWLGYMVTPCLTFWETAKLSPNGCKHFAFPPAVYEDSNFSTSSLELICFFGNWLLYMVCG